MSRIRLSRNFLRALEEKVPRKSDLAMQVADSLCIERESAYRRLRENVYLSADELGVLAREFDISLDRILNMSNSSKYLWMKMPKLTETHEFEYDLLEELYHTIKQISEQADSCHQAVFTTLISAIYYPYHEIMKFILFKWGYNHVRSEIYSHFDEMKKLVRFFELQQKFSIVLKNMKRTCFVWDEAILSRFVNDVKYFRDVELIREEDIKKIKDELYLFLADLEALAIRGEFEETGHKFELYISIQSIDDGYSCFCSSQKSICNIGGMFVRSDECNRQEVCAMVKNWVDSMKRISTLISTVGERDRILFFNRQRKNVEML